MVAFLTFDKPSGSWKNKDCGNGENIRFALFLATQILTNKCFDMSAGVSTFWTVQTVSLASVPAARNGRGRRCRFFIPIFTKI